MLFIQVYKLLYFLQETISEKIEIQKLYQRDTVKVVQQLLF